MGMHRTGKVWYAGLGWLAKRTENDAQYDELGDGWQLFVAVCRFFPDFLMDLCRSEDAAFGLSFIQRIFLRILARYQYVDITGCRGATKSFCVNGTLRIEGVMYPGVTSAVFGPSYIQSAAIASDINKQYDANYTILNSLYNIVSDGKGVFEIGTPYNTAITVSTFRGKTIHRAVAEETAQEENPAFDSDKYSEVVIPAVRAEYKFSGEESPAYIAFKQDSVTSAGRRQSYAYEKRVEHRHMMARGESAYIIDVPFQVILLEQMRPVGWAQNIKNEITGAKWMREMESVFSGGDKNPLIREELVNESRQLLLMEEHHCCKDRDNRLKPGEVIYILGYDVSYRDAKSNAKCAVAVMKCTRQKDFYHRDKYLKQVVWIEDWTPAETPTPIAQAQRLRRIFDRFTFEGSQTYIAIDAWQYGDGVLCALMAEPVGGARPLCVWRHLEKVELELDYAIPCIFPIRAGGQGVRDPDSDMINNMQMQFEHGNIQLLTQNLNEGVEAYKKYHRIKDDSMNWKIAQPYKKTAELAQQIQNLQEIPSGRGIMEKRISKYIQRDSWSAVKYAGRGAELLERSNLQQRKRKSDWDKMLAKYRNTNSSQGAYGSGIRPRRVTSRSGGRMF